MPIICLYQLNENIIYEIYNLIPYILGKVMATFVQRVRLCLNSNGGHLKDNIFNYKTPPSVCSYAGVSIFLSFLVINFPKREVTFGEPCIYVYVYVL